MAIARSRILLWSSLSGLLWILVWPALGGLVPLAFIAWLPILHAERLHDRRTIGRRSAFAPYVIPAVLIWNLGCSYWFFMVSEPLTTRLASYLVPVVVNTLLMTIPWWLRRVVLRNVGSTMAMIGFVLFWLAFERLHHNWDMQWPWFSLGNAFGILPSWIQWYEYTGMLGGSLWVLVMNLLLDRVVVHWPKDGVTRRFRSTVLTAALVGLLPISISLVQWHSHVEEGRPVEAVFVQPNVDPYLEKFGGVDAMVLLDRMVEQALDVMTEQTRLVVMPETALQEPSSMFMEQGELVVNGLWENDLERSRSIPRLRTIHQFFPQAGLLSGMSSNYLYKPGESISVTARALGIGKHYYDAANAAVYIPAGGALQHYRKSKLVAGVELMPFEKHLGALGHLAIDLGGTTGSLARQEERSVLTDDITGLRIIPAICYESVFGEHIAAHVRNGGNLIAIMTNDGWWSDAPGYRQHLAFAPLRAIETRRAIVRSANTGISCFVDQRGSILDLTEYWVRDARKGTVHLNQRITFFVRHGDLLGRAAVVGSLLLLMLVLVRMIQGWLAKAS